MIITKKFDAEKYRILKQNFKEARFIINRENDKMTFESEDSIVLDFVANNFEDYIEPELRLDAIEALVIGEQSTFSKIREALKL